MQEILIPLTQGKFAIIDEEDFEFVSKYKWYCLRNYAVTTIRVGEKRKIIRMHRIFMQEPSGAEVDHIDGNSLNNKRNNLRLATHRQNMVNRKANKVGTSKYKGVHYYKERKKWLAQTQVNGKKIYLGLFDCEKEAALAYNEAAQVYGGEFARVNEIKD